MDKEFPMKPINEKVNLVLERTTKKDLQDPNIFKNSRDSIHGTRRCRNSSKATYLSGSNNEGRVKQIDQKENPIASLNEKQNYIDYQTQNFGTDVKLNHSGDRLLNVDLGQLLLKRGIDEDQIDQFQQIVSFTSYNPKLPEIINQIEKPTSNLNESSVSITNEKQKCINNQVQTSIINQDQTAKLDQSADSISSQKDNSLISGNVQSISTQIDEADNREQVSLPKIEDNQYLSKISQYFQSSLDCQSDEEIPELARKSVTMKSESEAEKFIDSIFDWMSQQVKEQNQPLLSGKKERAKRSLFSLAVLMVQHSYRFYSYYFSGSINFIGKNIDTPVWPAILIQVNISLLVNEKRWDDLIEFFLDLARIRSLSLLSLVEIVSPEYLFRAEVMQSHSKLVEIVRRLVFLEHAYQSYSIINGCSKCGDKIIDKLQPHIREIWLGGTQSVIESDDWCSASRRKECLAGILGMIKETIDQYRLKKNPLADRIVNLDKEIETKFS